jgi:hypothetical protein
MGLSAEPFSDGSRTAPAPNLRLSRGGSVEELRLPDVERGGVIARGSADAERPSTGPAFPATSHAGASTPHRNAEKNPWRVPRPLVTALILSKALLSLAWNSARF